VVLDRPLTGDAAADAPRVLAALASGRSFSLVRGLATPASLEFGARQQDTDVAMGARTLVAGLPGIIRAAVPQAPDARVDIVHNNRPLATGQGSAMFSGPIGEGGYRVEVYRGGARVPWIVSNAIYAGGTTAPVPPEIPAPTPTVNVPQPGVGWGVEHDAASAAAWSIDLHAVKVDYQLGGGSPAGQFAALVTPVSGNVGVDRIEFVAHASPPMRLSLQIRLPGAGGQRWRRSVYVDETHRAYSVRLRDFAAVDRPTTLRPNVARVQAILFVVDTLNTMPGNKGSFWIFDPKIGSGSE
jgi:hypothetical protein